MESCDVLVVGAGPTGLTAAAVLRASGVDVRLVDKATGRLEQSRALAVQPRTLELLDKLGLADELVGAGVPVVRTNLHVDGRHVVSLPLGESAVGRTPFPFMLFVSQVDTERLLDRHLDRLGQPIERGTELLSLQPSGDAVVARLTNGGHERSVRCGWVIGADGAHSRVRHELGLSFDGDAYRSDFVLGDVSLGGVDLPLDQLHVFLGRSGLCVLFPLKGGKSRVIATRTRTGSEGELTFPELEETARAFIGSIQLRDPAWISRFHLHHRGVPRYRVGRCFVAGDAAHIHSPAGGQGMNTGIQDAYNLAWKLAMVVRGQAPESLLDSYHEERHPVGQRLLAFTDRAFAMGASEHPWWNAVRNWVAPKVVPPLAELGAPARVFGFVSQLGIRYRHSSAVDEDLTGSDAAFRNGPRAGDRAPGVTRLRDLAGTGWWLLGFTGTGAAAVPTEPWRRLLVAVIDDRRAHAVRMVEDPELHALYGLSGPGLVLVRPDGHIAFRSAGRRVDPLLAWWST